MRILIYLMIRRKHSQWRVLVASCRMQACCGVFSAGLIRTKRVSHWHAYLPATSFPRPRSTLLQLLTFQITFNSPATKFREPAAARAPGGEKVSAGFLQVEPTSPLQSTSQQSRAFLFSPGSKH